MKIIARCLLLSFWPVASRLLGQTALNDKPTISGNIKLAVQKSSTIKVGKEEEEPVSCGGAPSYDNAKPKNYEDTKKTKYDSETKKHVPVVFKAGDKIEFKCEKGYTTDGSNEGDTTFDVECKDSGFYKPAKVCVKASACGKLPYVKKATATGKVDKNKVQYKCNKGYSLDGEKVVAGGMGKNSLFNIECDEFAGEYKEFKGECQPYGFMPAGQILKVYNVVFETLFTATCEKTLHDKFGADQKPPKGLGEVCANLDDSSCSGLISDIKADFEKQAKALKEHKKESKKDWFEADDDKPGIKDQAKKFCEGLWKTIQMPGL
jgi:hypothetical protein